MFSHPEKSSCIFAMIAPMSAAIAANITAGSKPFKLNWSLDPERPVNSCISSDKILWNLKDLGCLFAAFFNSYFFLPLTSTSEPLNIP